MVWLTDSPKYGQSDDEDIVVFVDKHVNIIPYGSKNFKTLLLPQIALELF